MSKALADLIENHILERLDLNLFRGRSPAYAGDRVYGGQVLAQAINAAQHTVGMRYQLHSLHSYFLRPGDPTQGIIYEVDRIRDGRTFTTRRVVARQNGAAIFNTSLSYQMEEEGLEHQAEMPDVPPPSELISDAVRYADIVDQRSEPYTWPIEFRQVDPVAVKRPKKTSSYNCVWFKADGQLADDLVQHQELLAYASDNPILVTALRPHGVSQWSRDILMATIDHGIWFHRPFRIDEWLLFELDSTSASNGRGYTQGKIFDQAGRLVASVVQEGLLRHKRHK